MGQKRTRCSVVLFCEKKMLALYPINMSINRSKRESKKKVNKRKLYVAGDVHADMIPVGID